MKVIVFGSTGGIGRQAVEQALEAGHTVTAVARRPEKLTLRHENLRVVRGDVLDAAAFEPGGAVAGAMQGQAAVISAIGVEKREPTTLYSEGVMNIARAMRLAGVRRMLCISATGLKPGPFFQRVIAGPILWAILRDMYTDLVRMEEFVKRSELDWTIVRPPRLTDGPRTGKYEVKINTTFHRGGWSLSRADTADFMVTHLADPATYCATVEVAY
jgi:putative NADH-flavin reductase